MQPSFDLFRATTRRGPSCPLHFLSPAGLAPARPASSPPPGV